MATNANNNGNNGNNGNATNNAAAATMKAPLTAKQVNAGCKEVKAICSTLNQVLKQFGGVYDTPLKSGQTVEQFMQEMGVIRPTKTDKRGRVTRLPYGTKNILDAWHQAMRQEDGTAMVFKNTPVTYTEGENVYNVYTEEQTKATNPKRLTVYQLRAIPADGWNMDLLTKGLRQGHISQYEQHAKKARKSLETLDAQEALYILKTVKDEVAGTERGVWVEIDADLVEF